MSNEPVPVWRAAYREGRLQLLPNPEIARRKILALEHIALQGVGDGSLVSAECPLQHSFIDGVYVRTIFIPAGTRIIGKIHKHSHANILSQGKVRVFTEGAGAEEIEGPRTMVSPAGCKRVVDALTDVVWTTVHATGETDLDKIEDFVIAKTYDDLHDFRLENAMNETRVLQ